MSAETLLCDPVLRHGWDNISCNVQKMQIAFSVSKESLRAQTYIP